MLGLPSEVEACGVQHGAQVQALGVLRLMENHAPHERGTAAPEPQSVVAMWQCGMSVTRASIWSGKKGNLKILT